MRQPVSDNPRVYSDELHRMGWEEYGLLVLAEADKRETRRNARRWMWRAGFCVGLLLGTAVGLVLYGPLVIGN